MKLINILPVRNEAWVLPLSLRAMTYWCDEVVVLLHACTDDSERIVREVADETGRVHVIVDHDPVWREMSHRQRLLEVARERGATHIATVDADEVLCADTMDEVRRWIEVLPPGGFASIPMRNLHRSLYRYRSDNGIWGRMAGTVLAFADAPTLHWRAANGYDHHHRNPYNSRQAEYINIGGGLMHLQFASWRRLLAKHSLYKVTERLRWPDKSVGELDRLYSLATDETGCLTSPTPDEWWAGWRDCLHLTGLRGDPPVVDLDGEPWQEAEVRRLIAQHGAERFAGLNLFGVDQCEQAHAISA